MTAQEIGSAKPGNRALSLPYSKIDLQSHRDGANKCDFYTCELYPENRKMFSEVIKETIDYPAEYGYGLVGNKWLMKEFQSCIGLIGAKPKLMLVEELMFGMGVIIFFLKVRLSQVWMELKCWAFQ